MMSEMIERVCRALCSEWAVDPDGTEGFLLESAPLVPDKGEPNWTGYEPLARAVIEAMREPTEAMTDAGWRRIDERDDAAENWRLMIDEALRTEKA
jgi:hypothetical protein